MNTLQLAAWVRSRRFILAVEKGIED